MYYSDGLNKNTKVRERWDYGRKAHRDAILLALKVEEVMSQGM